MQNVVVEYPVVCRAKILCVHTNRLLEAFENFDPDLTKSLLLEVEIELSDLDSDIPNGLTDQEYELITSIN